MEETVKNRVVKTIPAKSRAQILGRTDSRKIRTGAYARVSTDRSEQEDSYERQVDYFTRYINANPDWEFAGVFADPAITGTRADKRPEFNRMLQACRAKEIDRIIVKSISRFARNTVDALTYIRELKELGVAIYFDNEKIDTMTPGGEILITILAGMAEQESRNIAKNVTWAFEKKMLRGDIILNTTRFLGYKKNEDGTLSIVPEEAEIVSRIYSEFLQGYSTSQIAHHLMDDGVPSPSGNKGLWYPSTILSMLKNEKYMGTVIQGKTFKPDVLSKKRHKNVGQRELHTMEDCIPAIISKKKFELVQTMLGARNNLRSATQTGEGKFSSKYAFSGMLYCGTCGGKLRRHAIYRQGTVTRTWACATHVIHGDEECTARCVKEDDIKDAFVRALQKMMDGKYAAMLTRLKQNIKEEVIAGDREQIARLTEQIDELREQILTKNRSQRMGVLNDVSYSQEVAELEMRIDAIEHEKQKLMDNVGCLDTAKNRIENMFAAIERIKNNAEFDDGVFKELVESVIITEDRQAEIHFNCGITVKERLEINQ
jgi:DNA invertase Pin-like site-specific DNA recombinase